MLGSSDDSNLDDDMDGSYDSQYRHHHDKRRLSKMASKQQQKKPVVVRPDTDSSDEPIDDGQPDSSKPSR